MRFHATFTHSAESCPTAHGSGPTVPDWPARAKEVGVELISAAVCGPAHTQFFFVETDDMSKLAELFRPLNGFAKADITPVRDLIIPQ